MRTADVTLTTAKLREKALHYENQLQWELAAQCWQECLNRYPKHHPNSQLAIRDKQIIEWNIKNCLRTAQREKEV